MISRKKTFLYDCLWLCLFSAALVVAALYCPNPLPAQTSGYAYRVRPAATLPAVCTPGNGDIVFLTAGTGSPGLYTCTAANTWTAAGTNGNNYNLPSLGTFGFGSPGATATTVLTPTFVTPGGAQGIIIGPQTFGNLGAGATNGSIIYCSDCTIASPCAGGGTGALAKRLNGVWVCN